ncbi:hypothetical protein ACQUSY_03335 [Microbacterium sp. YY-03]|uniref:hypothetical protein n=1 Tax=Microbacterium sp. YY-03 TaxID=3421636 RepID=UPI003D179982
MTPPNDEPKPGDLPEEGAESTEPLAAADGSANDAPIVAPPSVGETLGTPYAPVHPGNPGGPVSGPPVPPGPGYGAPLPPGAYPGANGSSPYGPPAPGSYPYGSGGYQPGMMPPEVEDNRPGMGWGILGGFVVVLLCVLVVALSSGWGARADAWFVGVTLAFAIVPIVATILVIPFQTRKIGQGLFIVLGALPLIWFGVCVGALSSY